MHKRSQYSFNGPSAIERADGVCSLTPRTAASELERWFGWDKQQVSLVTKKGLLEYRIPRTVRCRHNGQA